MQCNLATSDGGGKLTKRINFHDKIHRSLCCFFSVINLKMTTFLVTDLPLRSKYNTDCYVYNRCCIQRLPSEEFRLENIGMPDMLNNVSMERALSFILSACAQCALLLSLLFPLPIPFRVQSGLAMIHLTLPA